MPRRRVLGCLLAVVALIATGCSDESASNTTGSTSLTVYSSLPLQGAQRDEALSVLNAEKLALIEADGKVGEFTVKLVALDDSTAAAGGWDPTQTSKNARRALRDRTAIAYLGESDSGATAISLPILNAIGLMQVSPGASYVGLSKRAGAGKGEPEKFSPTGKLSFARTVPADDVQARAQLRWQAQEGCTRLYVLDDATFYGRGVARELARQADADGRAVVGTSSVPDEGGVDGAVKDVTDADADCVFIGAIDQDWTAGLLAALHAADPSAGLYAPDELATSAFAAQLTPGVQSVLHLTDPALPDRYHPPAARDFVASYKRRFGEAPAPKAIFGYEAMKLVLVAINQARGDGNDRRVVRRELLRIRRRNSVLGSYSITGSGDTTSDDYGRYTVQGGKLRFERKVDTQRG